MDEAAVATAAVNGTSKCAETELPAQSTFADDAPNVEVGLFVPFLSELLQT